MTKECDNLIEHSRVRTEKARILSNNVKVFDLVLIIL